MRLTRTNSDVAAVVDHQQFIGDYLTSIFTGEWRHLRPATTDIRYMMPIARFVKQTVKDELQIRSRQIIVCITICQCSCDVKQPTVNYFFTSSSLSPQIFDLRQIVELDLTRIQEIIQLADIDRRTSDRTIIYSDVHFIHIKSDRYKDILPAVQIILICTQIDYRNPVRTTNQHLLDRTVVPASFIIGLCPCILHIFGHRHIHITIRNRRRRYIIPYLNELTPVTVITAIKSIVHHFDFFITSTERNPDRIFPMRIGIKRTNLSIYRRYDFGI